MLFINYKSNSHVVSFVRGDVSGDKIPDNIYLTGTKTPNSPFTENITLIIQDSATRIYSSIPLNYNAGYNPTLFLGDFTNNGVKDILVSIASGGSGGFMYYYIYSFENNREHLLFDFELYNKNYKYDVSYKDYYKIEALSENNNRSYIIDITHRDENYLNKIYTKNGTLKNPIHGFVNPLSGLYPVDFDSNGTYELLAYQKIAGMYNADSLGYFLNKLKWEDNRFILDYQNVAIGGQSI